GALQAFHEDRDANRGTVSVNHVTAGPNQVTFVRDATALSYRHYIGGVGDPGDPFAYASNASDFRNCVPFIGRHNGPPTFSNPLMDELAIWHRALSADQVATIAWLNRKKISIQSWVDGGSSCADILRADPTSISGVYSIKVRTAGGEQV